MTYDEQYDLLIRYVDGEVSNGERAQAEHLIKTDAAWRKEYELLSGISEAVSSHVNIKTDTEASWLALKERIAPQPVVKHRSLRPWIWASAAAVLVIALSWFLLYPRVPAYSDFNSEITYNTGNGEMRTVLLPDGSVVLLNENSSLQVDRSFNQEKRRLLLNGNAYFQVAASAGKPFTIKTSNTYTTVIGTTFEIRQKTSGSVDVFLINGKLDFQSGLKRSRLTSGDRLTFEKGRRIMVSHNNNLSAGEWVIQPLVYKDALLSEILAGLERQYGIKVQVSEKIPDERYTIEFSKTNLETNLKLIEAITDAKFTRAGPKYLLNP